MFHHCSQLTQLSSRLRYVPINIVLQQIKQYKKNCEIVKLFVHPYATQQ